jgi:ectoine hydroxylase-related dioxygenase (phytanoyl-CoA dioxygenase family)
MKMNKEHINQLKSEGYFIIKNAIPSEWVGTLSKAMYTAFERHRKVQKKYNNDITTDGVALHVLISDDVFIQLVYYICESGIIEDLQTNFFGSPCILNSFSALNNLPKQSNFSSVVHRDLRFYSGDFPMMLNCLIMIDDFTIENGATYLLPGSHLDKSKPSDEEFFNNAIQAVGSSGDLLVFNSNLWHASAPNKTDKDRKALPFTISRSFMKQLFDYPRGLGYNRMHTFSNKMQQFLGYHSRVPASLIEWYQPEEERFYKKNQD